MLHSASRSPMQGIVRVDKLGHHLPDRHRLAAQSARGTLPSVALAGCIAALRCSAPATARRLPQRLPAIVRHWSTPASSRRPKPRIAESLREPPLSPRTRARSPSNASACAASGSTSRSRRGRSSERARRQIPDLAARNSPPGTRRDCSNTWTSTAQRCYFNRAPSNLFRLSAAAVKRRSSPTPPCTDGPIETANAHHREVRDAGAGDGQARSVAPRRVRVTYSLTVKPMPCPPAKRCAPGCRFRARIPGQQEDVRLRRAARRPST